MLISYFFKRQNFIQIYTKTHHLEKISLGHAPEQGQHQSTWFLNLKKIILTPPPLPLHPHPQKNLGEGGCNPPVWRP